MLIILSIIILILFSVCICSAVVIIKMRKKIQRAKTQVLKVLRQMRYGQFNINLSTFQDENIRKTAEKLIESLQDREKMISEYKQILIEKNKSLEQMILLEKESQKFKDDFVAALTHDLKTPVIAEVNAVKMLLAGNFGEINDAQKEVLEIMLKSDKDLIELSEMLLQTYKYQQADVELHKTQVDIADFVSSVFEEAKPLFSTKNQNPFLNINLGEKFFVDIDSIHFKRVLNNLLINAAKYSYEDSDVVVELFVTDEKIAVKITNDGETINPDDAKLIFEKYYSGIKKFSNLGTGLGLYCANKIVAAHNGKIDVTSENGKTSFTVFLPLNNNY